MISTKIQNQSSVVTTDNNYPFVSAPYIKSTSESVACILLKQYNIQLAHKPSPTLKHELSHLKELSQGSPRLQTNSKTVLVLPFFYPSLIFPFHLLPSPVHPIGISFYIFPGFLAIFILSLNNGIKLENIVINFIN